jgi:hypothetical protein
MLEKVIETGGGGMNRELELALRGQKRKIPDETLSPV